jgi:hypothetical protein
MKECRDFRCCHKVYNGIFTADPNMQAGPYGSMNCDFPMKGAREFLTILRDKLINVYSE